jgi:hypothetical protein
MVAKTVLGRVTFADIRGGAARARGQWVVADAEGNVLARILDSEVRHRDGTVLLSESDPHDRARAAAERAFGRPVTLRDDPEWGYQVLAGGD